MVLMCVFLSFKASIFSYSHSCFIFVKWYFMSSHFLLPVFFLVTWRSILKNCIHDTNNLLYLYGLWPSTEFLCLYTVLENCQYQFFLMFLQSVTLFLVLKVFESYGLFCHLSSLSNFLSSWLLFFILGNFFSLIFHLAILFNSPSLSSSTCSLVGICPQVGIVLYLFPLVCTLMFRLQSHLWVQLLV